VSCCTTFSECLGPILEKSKAAWRLNSHDDYPWIRQMKLVIKGMTNGSKTQFQHLWGRYVLGFKPWTHCLKCFSAKKANEIHPTMVDGEYALESSFDIFYLCCVGWRDRANTNVHLAVRPRLGSVASTGSVYGVQFTISDAQAILIQYLPKGWKGLEDRHSQCKNFQFGYQTFQVDQVGDSAPREVVTARRA
jgi:hypothetical protein